MSDKPADAADMPRKAPVDGNIDYPEIASPRGGQEWDTTAEVDGDCAIFEVASKQLIGVGATPRQTKTIVDAHKVAIDAEREHSLADQPAFRKAIDANLKLIKQLAAERKSKNLMTQDALNLKKQLAKVRRERDEARKQFTAEVGIVALSAGALAAAQALIRQVANGLKGQRGLCLNCDSAVTQLEDGLNGPTALDAALAAERKRVRRDQLAGRGSCEEGK